MEASQSPTLPPTLSAAPGRRSAAFWAATGPLAFGMIAGGSAQLVHAKLNVEGMLRLGYPLYTLTIIGLWKLAGILVILLPRLPLAKEWAYAGLFFLLTSATLSHLVCGDGIAGSLAPFVFACLTAASWHLRPTSRRLPAARA